MSLGEACIAACTIGGRRQPLNSTQLYGHLPVNRTSRGGLRATDKLMPVANSDLAGLERGSQKETLRLRGVWVLRTMTSASP